MTYGVITTVAGSADAYQRIHEAALRRTRGVLDGLLLHVGRETNEGFEVIEVWNTKEQCERCNREILRPLLADTAAEMSPGDTVTQEFEPRGLILTGTRIAR